MDGDLELLRRVEWYGWTVTGVLTVATERAPMPTARGGLAAAVVGGEVHVVGGGAGAPLATQ